MFFTCLGSSIEDPQSEIHLVASSRRNHFSWSDGFVRTVYINLPALCTGFGDVKLAPHYSPATLSFTRHRIFSISHPNHANPGLPPVDPKVIVEPRLYNGQTSSTFEAASSTTPSSPSPLIIATAMIYHKLVASVLVIASALVQASPTVPRNNDDFESGFLNALNNAGLTTLSGLYKDFFQTEQGPDFVNTLKNGKFTILAPDNQVRLFVPRIACCFVAMPLLLGFLIDCISRRSILAIPQ